MESLARLVAEAEDTVTAETRLLRLAELRQAVDAAMVAALAEIEAAPGPVWLDGATDGGQWLASRTDLHPAEAGALAGLARDLPDMPATHQALEQGRIGIEKARLLGTARQADEFPDAEASLVEHVVGVSLRAARRIIGRFLADHRPPAANDDPAANEVTLTPKRNGRWRLHGDLDTQTAILIANELRRLANHHRDDEDLSTAHRTALGFLDMARRSVTLGQRGPGSRPELVVVADLSTYGHLHDHRYEDGTPVPVQVFENLTCDTTIRRLLTNGPSETLDLGRAQRLATPGQRRAAAIRDGGCVYPGCERPPDDCDLHHLHHWTRGGHTDLANLCLLCRRHHTLTHTIGFTFIRRPNGYLTIHRPDGTPLPWPRQQAA